MGIRSAKKTLVQKLGIKPGFVIAIKNAPHGYEKTLGRLPTGFIRQDGRANSLDFIQYFAHSGRDLKEALPTLKKKLKFDGMLWVSWSKTRAKQKSDLNESIIRALGIKSGFVNVKVCAIDSQWSGLKFIYPRHLKRHRDQRSQQLSKSNRAVTRR